VTAGYIISTVEDLREPIQAIEDRIMSFKKGVIKNERVTSIS